MRSVLSSLCHHKLHDVLIRCSAHTVNRLPSVDQTRLPLTPNPGETSPQATPYLTVTFPFSAVPCGAVYPLGESEDIMLVLGGPSQGSCPYLKRNPKRRREGRTHTLHVPPALEGSRFTSPRGSHTRPADLLWSVLNKLPTLELGLRLAWRNGRAARNERQRRSQ